MGFNFFTDVVDLEILNFYLIVLRIFQISTLLNVTTISRLEEWF